jgi:hypothetical protein
MGGFRYLNMNEGIDLGRSTTFSTDLGAFPAFAGLAGNRIDETDTFRAHHHFYGGQFGIRANAYLHPAIITGYAQVALGLASNTLQISGQSIRTTAAGQQIILPGGVLSRPETVGRFKRTRFAYVPEMGVGVSFPIMDCLTISSGFSALHLNHLLRPADHVRQGSASALVSVPALASGPATTSSVVLRDSGVWLLGFHVGAELRF